METIFIPKSADIKDIAVTQKLDELEEGQTLVLIINENAFATLTEIISAKDNSFTLNKTPQNSDELRVEITRTVTPNRSCSIRNHQKKNEPEILDVTRLEPKLRHATIFGMFDKLKNGEHFTFMNDHDPKPLYYQMLSEKGSTFNWTYLEKGPVNWKVEIKKNDAQTLETIGSIVAKDIRKAAIFKKYGIDFCCGGKKSLQDACAEKGLDVEAIRTELQAPSASPVSGNNYNDWKVGFLADFIYNQHHLYYYNEAPVIKELLSKVVEKHGSTHPELIRLQQLFIKLSFELDTHFAREERVLFPFIKSLSIAKSTGNFTPLKQQPSLVEPIQMMEADHEAAGDILKEMNETTNGFTPPKNACNSLQFLYKKLQDLEEDLHQHIHLENNMLFPKALALDKTLRLEQPLEMNSSS